MLVFPPPARKKRKGPLDAVKAAPAALTLIAASFDPDGPEVYLTFDRPISIAGLVIGQFAMMDGPDGHQLIGFEAPELLSPTEVLVLMTITGPASGDDVLLTVGAGNGIVAVDDRGTWGGTSALTLPFP